MLNKIKVAEKAFQKTIKSKAGRKGISMYKEIKSNVIKPSLVKKTVGGFSKGVRKEREVILNKKYQKAVQEWRASMLRLCLEMIDAIELAMIDFGHSKEDAKAYADRVMQRTLVIKERLNNGKYDCMIEDSHFAIDTFTAELIAASGMGLHEQKFYNSFINSEEYKTEEDDEFDDDWDLDEDLPDDFEGTVEEYRLSEEVSSNEDYSKVIVSKPKVEIVEDDEYRKVVRQRRITYLVNLRISTTPAINHCDDAMKILTELDEEVSKINSGEYDDMSDNDFYSHINTDIMEKVTKALSKSSKDLGDETTEEVVDEVVDDDTVEPETIGETVEDEQPEVEVVDEVVDDDTVEPETASEAVEAAVKEVLEIDAESNSKYPAKKKGRKPANASEK